MAPSFSFCIDEIAENPAYRQYDARGNWIPSTTPGANYRTHLGASNQWWFCNGQSIQRLPGGPPYGASVYKVFSTFYSGGHGFWILQDDAANESSNGDKSWHNLWFEYNTSDYSSFLTNAGRERTLRCQRINVRWPHMLLPSNYHGQPTQYDGYGGLTGELPIFLSLLAFSMAQDRLSQELTNLMQNGAWTTHSMPNGRIDGRGVVVRVYSHHGNNSELRSYEEGVFGKYYE